MVEPFKSNPSLYPGNLNTDWYMAPALPGMVNGFGNPQVYPYINNVGLLEKWTLTLPATPTANATYKFGVSGYTVSVTTDADPTKAELAQALLNAVRTDVLLFSEIEFDRENDDNFTIWAKQVGKKLVITLNPAGEVAAPLTVTRTQETKVGDVIPFGRIVGRTSDRSLYFRDPLDGFGPASLPTSTTGFELLGVTRIANFYEKVGRFQDAKSGYPFESTMDVLNNTGTMEGIWIECLEPDIQIGQPLFCTVGDASTGGKVSRVATGAIALGSSVIARSDVATAFGYQMIKCKVEFAA